MAKNDFKAIKNDEKVKWGLTNRLTDRRTDRRIKRGIESRSTQLKKRTTALQ